MKNYTSHAQWPEGTMLGIRNDVSSDKHRTHKEAQFICTMLEEQGFGGEGKIFPIRTWVSNTAENDNE